MAKKQQSSSARTLKMRGSPVRTASWPTSSPGWVTNRRDSSSRSASRWNTSKVPEITNRMLTSWGSRGREGERQRQKERETDREREINRDKERETETETERYMEEKRNRYG